MNKQDQFIALFGLLNKAFNEGKLHNLKVSRTTSGDCCVGFEWVTLQPFELHVDFVFDVCQLCLGFYADEAQIKSFSPAIQIEDWRRLVAMMDDRLASVERFLTQVREELLKTQD